MPEPTGDLREQLRAAIDAAGRHQVTIARDLGISQKHLCAMLTGRARLTLEWADRIAEACGREVVAAVAVPDGDLRERLREALTREHHRRARKRIEASPEEHCAGFADAVLPVVEAALAQQAAEIDEDIIKPERALHEQTIQRAEQAERERDDYRERFTNQMTAGSELVEKLQQAEAAVRRVRGVHNGGSAENTVLCVACCEVLPCPTLRALDAEQPEETPRRLTEQQGGIPNDAYTADDYPKGM